MTHSKPPFPIGQILAITLSTALGGFLSLLLFTWGNLRVSGYGAVAWGVLGLLIGLSLRYPVVDRAMRWGMERWERTTPWLFALFGPVVLAIWFARAGLFGFGLWTQAVVLGFWGFVLGGLIWLIAWPDARKAFLRAFREIHVWAPLLYAVNIGMVAVVFFAAAGTFAAEAGLAQLRTPGAAGNPAAPFPTDPAIVHGKLMDFFAWHFLDSVPALKINEALHWAVPLDYDGAAMGVLLIGFKLAVIGPVIAACVQFWTEDKAIAEANERAAERARTEQTG